MSAHSSEALTLRSYPYSESHKIVVFLTRDFGKVRGVAYRAKKTAARFGSSLEPLTYLKLTFSRNEHQDLSVIQSCETLKAFSSERMTWERSLYFSYFSELLNEFSKEEEESEKLFRLALAVLEASRTASVELLARYFELWLLQLEGVLPEFEGRLPGKLAVKSRMIMKLHPAELASLSLSPGEAKILDSLCGELVEYHLEKQLKARKILKQLL